MKGEYLVTNGLGGYSSSHFMLGNIRKYHGLYVHSVGELDRFILINRLDEYISVGDHIEGFSTNHYAPNTIYPNGHQYLTNFYLDNNPIWEYELPNGVKVKREIAMKQGIAGVSIRYSFSTQNPAVLQLVPLFTYRNIHKIVKSKSDLVIPKIENVGEQVFVEQGNNKLVINFAGGELKQQLDTVYKNIYYPIEEQRGYEAIEVAAAPIKFVYLIPSGESGLELSIHALEHQQSNYQIVQQPDSSVSQQDRLAKRLYKNARQFVVQTHTGLGIAAGYHWFGEWGRDTFIAFKGILIEREMYLEAKQLLLRWSKKINNGLLPNQFMVSDENSSDAILWYVVAVYQYYLVTHDIEFVQYITPLLENVYRDILDHKGHIKITDEGFYYDMEGEKARTWMDALVEGLPVIDRSGAAVELQGLWYNFVCILLEFKNINKDKTFKRELNDLKKRLETNFMDYFWNSGGNYLFDGWKYEGIDRSLRPNQVMLLYLPFKLVNNRKGRQILATVERELLTDVGLRTLQQSHPDYHERYQGEQQQRDRAYHQGVIWPFLLGLYLDAYLDFYRDSTSALKYVKSALNRFEQKLSDQGLLYVPEIFDPTTYEADGCISQAWSVATILSVVNRVARLEIKNEQLKTSQ